MEVIHWTFHAVLIVLLIIFALDGLTFLWVHRIYQVIYHFVIKSQPHQIILIDIDGFKSINDQYGHPFGNRLLRKIGFLILKKSRLRGFRYGGEEFAVLLPWADEKKAVALAEQIRRGIEIIKIDALQITVSIGIGQHEQGADEALYRVKANGGNRIEVARPG